MPEFICGRDAQIWRAAAEQVKGGGESSESVDGAEHGPERGN